MSVRHGYKFTDLGEIPNDWSVTRLGDVAIRLENGVTFDQSSDRNGLPVTRIETISDERIDEEKVGFLDVKEEDIRGHELEIGDILFSHINSIEHIGKTAIY